MRSVALGLWVRTGSRDETPAQAGRLALPRAPAVQGHRAPLGDRDLRAASTAWAPRSTPPPARRPTHLHARFLDEHTEEAFDLLAEMLLAPDLPRNRLRARGRARGDRDVRGRAPGPRPRRARRGRLRRPPAGPPGARRGRGDRLDPGPRHRRLPRRPLHGRQHRRRRRRPPRPRARSSSWPSAWLSRRPATAATALDGRPRRPTPRLALLREGHRAVPHLLRRPGHRARRRAPLRARRPRRDLRRLDLLAPLPRGPREARASPTRSAPTREQYVDGGLVAIYVGTREDNVEEACEIIGRELGALRDRAGHRRGARRAPRSTSRAAWCSPRSRPRRGCRGSPARSCSTCRCSRSTRCSRGSTRSAPTTSPSWPPSSTTRAALGRLRRPRRGPLPQRALGAGQRGARGSRGDDPGRRLRRRGAHGRRPSARRSRRADDMELAGRADPALDVAARRRRSTTPTWSSTSRTPDDGARERPRLPRGRRPRRGRHHRLRPRRAARDGRAAPGGEAQRASSPPTSRSARC